MPDATLVQENPDGSATVVTVRFGEHVFDMPQGAVSRLEIVSKTTVPGEERV